MKYYKYETHCHDKMGSGCANNLPEEVVELYYNSGYSGLVFTNHFLRGNTAIDRSLPWKEKMEGYYNAYLRGKNSIDPEKFTVLFGIEHNYGNGKEVLTYGIDLDFLLANPEIHNLPLMEYSRRVREYGGFVSQAHPFRDRGYINSSVMPQPEALDAIEVYNHCNEPEENFKAKVYAKEHGLISMSGSDFHTIGLDECDKGGIALPFKIKTSKELIEAIKKGEHKLIINGEIKDSKDYD